MSVESQHLERAALEKKDRNQLQSIATAMGRKPPSRMRKAEIVDLILELAGVPTSGNGGSTSSPDALPFESSDASAKAAAPEGDSRRSKGRPAPDDADEPSGADTAEAPKAESGEGAAPSRGNEGGERTNGQRPPRRRRASGGGGADTSDDASAASQDDPKQGESKGQDEERAERNGEAEARSDRQRNDQGDGGRKNGESRGEGSDRSRNDQNGSNDQPERTGRRRRRRGRDKGDRPQPQDDAQQPQQSTEPVPVEGLLDLRDEGYGFLRVKGLLPSKDDVYVSVKTVRQFGLRKGDLIAGSSRPASRNEKNPALLRVDTVNGDDPETMRARPKFEDLTPLFPDQKLSLESEDPTNMTARIIDLISPIGKGQRGLIVSPPKAGKTTVMKTIAQCIEANNPEVKVMILLVDERPEEVTDLRRSVRGEVVASTFDRPSDEHTAVAELTIERAKRRVEMGEDVVIILDGITRLARAYNMAAPATGRIMSGGIDTGALYPPKKFFGAARNVEEGGSLTILATALVETGSRMDEVIFEEFKGTGNMELRLDRRLAEKRIYPAIDVDASSTRHEELLFERRQLQMVWKLRRVLSGLADSGSGGAGLELLIDRMKTFKSNNEFLAEIAKAPSM